MIGRLLRLELLREARSRDAATTILLVGALVVVTADLAFHDLPQRAAVTAGTLWLAIVLAASVALAKGAVADADRGALDALLALPASRPVLFLALAGANAVLVLAFAAVAAPLHALLSGDAFAPSDLLLVPVVVLGAAGVAAAGTLLAAVSARTRARAAMLPALLLPVLAPLLVAALHATTEVLEGGGFDDVRAELLVLAGYDLALVPVAALAFEHAVEG